MKNKVKVIKTPKNIDIWFVEEKMLPMLAVEWQVLGGAVSDKKAGATLFMTSLLDEGAGDLDSNDFQEALEDKAIELSFHSDRESLGGSLKCLSEFAKDAFHYMDLALNKPRFDQDAIDRVRDQLYANLKRSATNPYAIADALFWGEGYKNHPLAVDYKGTHDSLTEMSRADVEKAFKKHQSKATLKVSVVGNIDEKTLVTLVDKVFGTWSDKQNIVAPNFINAPTKALHQAKLAIPQSFLQFALPAPKRMDKDFMPLFVMNHMLGGSSFTARLMKEVREKRGLTYGIYTNPMPMMNTSILMGSLSTKNEKAKEAMDVIKEEMLKMATDGAGEQELADAKAYLIGSYALRFDNSNSIAANLLRLMRDGFSPAYMEARNLEIDAVTAEDVLRVAKKYLTPDQMFIVAVGEPVGL